MFTEESVRAMYPTPSWCTDEGADYFDGASDYTPIIDAIGEVVVRVDDRDYQGDTRLLLRRGDKYAITTFGWGSCSGCDALQACSSWEQLVNLANGLVPSEETWKSLPEIREWVATHDWKGDYGWHSEGQQEFIDKVCVALEVPLLARIAEDA